MKKSKYVAVILAAAWSLQGFAVESSTSLTVPMNAVDSKGVGTQLGTVEIQETREGLLFTPKLKGLPAGVHGFHIHEHASCAAGMQDNKPAAAIAAGTHWDPENTGKHLGPYANGHRGDLPAMSVNANGDAKTPVFAPRIKTLKEVRGHALMIHAGGDNHSDTPKPAGGGGARLVCGVIPS